MRTVLVLVVLVACNREGDHCVASSARCEGDVMLVCKQPGANDDDVLSRVWRSSAVQ